MINNGFTNGTNVGSAAIANNTTSKWMMLAAASTIAGNLTILAAASNIIIIEASQNWSSSDISEYRSVYLFMKLL